MRVKQYFHCCFIYDELEDERQANVSGVYVRVNVCRRGGVISTVGGGAWISSLICDHLAPPGSCWLEPSRAARPVLPRCPMGFTERSPLLLEIDCHLIL